MRITGGEWRSRALRAPRGDATRPTSDRVREALFSMLVSDGVLDHEADAGGDLRVLDLYAGTGALALEALSRGAASAVVVEHAREAVAAIRDNVRSLGADPFVEVLPMKVDRALARLEKEERSFSIVFLDPPYADVRTEAFASILAAAAKRVARGPSSALVLEHSSADEAPAIEGLALDRSRTYGDTRLSLYRRP